MSILKCVGLFGNRFSGYSNTIFKSFNGMLYCVICVCVKAVFFHVCQMSVKPVFVTSIYISNIDVFVMLCGIQLKNVYTS